MQVEFNKKMMWRCHACNMDAEYLQMEFTENSEEIWKLIGRKYQNPDIKRLMICNSCLTRCKIPKEKQERLQAAIRHERDRPKPMTEKEMRAVAEKRSKEYPTPPTNLEPGWWKVHDELKEEAKHDDELIKKGLSKNRTTEQMKAKMES